LSAAVLASARVSPSRGSAMLKFFFSSVAFGENEF
jgi:hypothetical protein